MNTVRNKMAPDVGHRYILSYFFLRHISWLVSYYIFVPLKFSPNMITVLSIASGIAAAFLAIKWRVSTCWRNDDFVGFI